MLRSRKIGMRALASLSPAGFGVPAGRFLVVVPTFVLSLKADGKVGAGSLSPRWAARFRCHLVGS